MRFRVQERKPRITGLQTCLLCSKYGTIGTECDYIIIFSQFKKARHYTILKYNILPPRVKRWY